MNVETSDETTSQLRDKNCQNYPEKGNLEDITLITPCKIPKIVYCTLFHHQ